MQRLAFVASLLQTTLSIQNHRRWYPEFIASGIQIHRKRYPESSQAVSRIIASVIQSHRKRYPIIASGIQDVRQRYPDSSQAVSRIIASGNQKHRKGYPESSQAVSRIPDQRPSTIRSAWLSLEQHSMIVVAAKLVHRSCIGRQRLISSLRVSSFYGLLHTALYSSAESDNILCIRRDCTGKFQVVQGPSRNDGWMI